MGVHAEPGRLRDAGSKLSRRCCNYEPRKRLLADARYRALSALIATEGRHLTTVEEVGAGSTGTIEMHGRVRRARAQRGYRLSFAVSASDPLTGPPAGIWCSASMVAPVSLSIGLLGSV